MGIFNSIFGKSTKDILPICDVDIKRYLGTWYEVARFPHPFEKDLEFVLQLIIFLAMKELK